MRLAALLLVLALPACDHELDFQSAPPVQFGTDAPARWTVDINRVRDGVFRPYAPRCIDTVRAGHTVEFRNFLPDVPANVTAVSAPEPLYSPNLVRPYNYVGPDHPDNALCAIQDPGGGCAQRPESTLR